MRPAKPSVRSASAALAPARPAPTMAKWVRQRMDRLLVVAGVAASDGGEFVLHGLGQRGPGRLEGGQAVPFELVDDVVVVDADLGERGHHLGRVVVARAHGVAANVAVVGHRAQRGFGHRVHHAAGDQVDDVAGVGVGRILHPGGGPQGPLRSGPGPGEGVPAVGGEDLVVAAERQPGVGDRRRATERFGLGACRSRRGAGRSRCRRG